MKEKSKIPDLNSIILSTNHITININSLSTPSKRERLKYWLKILTTYVIIMRSRF